MGGNMKKITKLLSVFVIAGAIGTGIMGATGCKHKHTYSDEWTSAGAEGHYHMATCKHTEEHTELVDHVYDDDKDTTCNDCGYVRELPKPTPDPEPEHEHTWATNWSFDAVKHYKVCTHEGCNEHTQEGNHDLGDDLKCKVCGTQFRNASFEFVPSNLDATTYNEGCKSGIFSVLPDTTVRNRARGANGADPIHVKDLKGNTYIEAFSCTRSVQYNGTNRGFSVNVPAPGKLSFIVENGSSTVAGDVQKIVLVKPDGSETTLEYPKTGLHAIIIDCTEAGEYKVIRGGNGTTDVYYAKFEAVVPVTPVEKIEIADKGKVEFIVGETFDKSKLQLQKVYEMTQMVVPIDITDAKLTVDASAFNGSVAGEYTIKITYTDENDKEHKASYTVNVYDVEAIELGFNKIVTGTSGYNGTYENKPVQQFYFTGDVISLDGLTVKTVFNGGKKKNIVTEGFNTNKADIDMSTPGVKEIVVKWQNSETIIQKFKIYVAEKPATLGDTVNVKVDGTIADAEVGTTDQGVYQFKTIQQSLEFLGALELDQNVKKVIQLAEGTYAEKLEVNIPNLTIKGSADKENAHKYVIEWDALYGELDESGFAHQTDSTATLNVRKDAEGFVIEGVTISNKWNSEEYFDEMKGPKYNEHRALAVLIQADKVVVDNCRMLGYQDTLELFTGRQIIQNTYIQGRTDFIFGTNNTTYFKNCEIRSIVKGGYVTAFKGSNKGEADSVLYGAIFDECEFTAPADVVSATGKDKTAIGRPWGQYAAVAVINSKIGAHISKEGNDNDDAAGKRYVVMSGVKPTAATVKFVEYNNTGFTEADGDKAAYGDGSISEAVTGMKMLTETEAANYSDFAKIFATTNGNVTYSTAWDGSKGVTVTTKKYGFNADTLGAVSSHSTEAAGEDYFNDEMTIIAVSPAKFRTELTGNSGPKDFLWVSAGCVIKMNVAGKVTITSYGGNYGNPENFVIEYDSNGMATITVRKTAASPINNDAAISLIEVDTADVPQPTVKYNVTFNYNDEGATANNVESVVSGEKVLKPADPVWSGHTFKWWYTGNDDTVEYNFDTPITEAIELKAKWESGEQATEYAKGSVIDMSAITQVYQQGSTKESGMELGVMLDATATGAKIQANGDNSYLTNGATIKVKVAQGLTVLPVWHNATARTGFTVSERDTEGYVTIAANAGATNYIMKILVIEDYDPESGASIDLSQNNLGANVTIQNHYASNGIIEIDATASGAKLATYATYSQVNGNTVLKVKAPTGASDLSRVTVTITAYNGTDITDRYTPAFAEGYYTLTAISNDQPGCYPATIEIEITPAA